MCVAGLNLWGRNLNSYQVFNKKTTSSTKKNGKTILGLTLRDRVRNEDLRKRIKIKDIIDRITRSKWRWAGHIARLKDGR